ncbi:hypothetical protein [Paucisalibacillus sp. EB02]|nr:hypothetical protein [Paucisalibacillus sp. EB02]
MSQLEKSLARAEEYMQLEKVEDSKKLVKMDVFELRTKLTNRR